MKKILLFLLSGIVSFTIMALPRETQNSKGHSRPQPEKLKIMPQKNQENVGIGKNIQSRLHSDNFLMTEFERPTKSSLNALTRTDTDEVPFYGYMVWSSVDYNLGLYEIYPDSGYKFYFEDPGWNELGFDLVPYNGWYSDGKLNGISLYWYNQFSIGAYFSYSINFETGAIEDYKEYYDWADMDYLFDVCTLNTDDGMIYGYAIQPGEDVWNYYWATSSPQDPTNIKIIREAEYGENFQSICYRADEGCFYGITATFDFIKIDTKGNYEYINYAPYYENAMFYNLQTGLIWEPKDGLFYWNAQVYDYNFGDLFGFLYSITPEGEFKPVEQYSYDQQFSFFVSDKIYKNEEAPMEPTIEDLDFEGPSLEGSMTVVIPTSYNDGSLLPEGLTYTALVNDEVYKTGTVSPGEKLTVNYTLSVSANYIFGIYVTSNGVKSKTSTAEKYVGFDVPMKPDNIVLTPTGLRWDAVTMGEHSGYIDAEDIKYNVILNGEPIGTYSTTYCELDLEKYNLAKYKAEVIAESSGMVSEPGVSNTIVAGKALELPQTFLPTEEEFEFMTVINANGDKYLYDPMFNSQEITWELLEVGLYSGGTEFINSKMDDYVFLPPINFSNTADNYNIKFETGRYSDWYPNEFLNVVYATSPDPEGVKGYILEGYTPGVYLRDTKWEEWDLVDETFNIPAEGEYYIGFQCVSAPQQYGIFLRNISIVNLDEVNGISSVSTGLSPVITAEKGMITVGGCEGELVTITGIDGKIISNSRANGNAMSYIVTPGVYVVKAGGKIVKLKVR